MEYRDEILEKMKNSNYSELSVDFLILITNESPRGGILVGAAKVEDELKDLIEAILPRDSNKYLKKQFDYPGLLSSFSAKIETLYAFRFIDERMHKSLNAIRSVRNVAAHSKETFTYKKIEKQIKEITDFEEHFSGLATHLGTEKLIKFKESNLREIILEQKDKVSKEHLSKLYEKNKDEIRVEVSRDGEYADQLLNWELASGLTLLCIKIRVIKDKYQKLEDKSISLDELI